jgi:hypothetical protein
MKNIRMTLLVLGAALIFTGCAPSLHPFFDEENVVFKEALLGSWISDSGEKCTFTKSGENHYEFLYVDETPARFEARLIEFDGLTFLDLYPKGPDNGNGLYLASLVPAHTLARLTIGENAISIALLDDDWLRKRSDRHQLTLAHERLADGAIVLTAPTGDLQAFVRSNVNNKEVFGDPEIFRRLGPVKSSDR